MGDEPNIAELAVAAWRLERWLDNLNAERKMAAKKSLREIKKYLEASGIEIVDPVGWKFDPGLAIEVVNNEADDVDESELIVVQTNAPIVKKDGGVIQYGKVILGLDIKEQKSNKEIRTDAEIVGEENGTVEGAQSKSTEAVLKLSEMIVDEKGTYWLRVFDFKAIRDGYQAVIFVDSDTDSSVLLMDEQVFKKYCNGVDPMNPFDYYPKAGRCFIVPPYADIWYALVRPPKGHTCDEYKLDLTCDWMKIDDIQRAKMQSEKPKQEQ